MSFFRKKFISILLSLSIIGTASAFTAYADEFDDTVTDDYVSDDSNTGNYTPPVETPPVVEDPPAEIPPVVETPDDNTGDYGDDTPDVPDTPDVTPDDSYDDTGNENSGVTDDDTDYDTSDDYYEDDYCYEDDYYYDDYYYEPQYSDYNYGMSFDDFERATDYSSAIVDTETPTVDMYNSNGSDNITLSSADWNEIKLNLGGKSADGTGDFSFIKDNDSDENSNASILFLIFGVVFVLSSVALIVYIIATAIRSRKLQKAGAYSYARGRSHNSRRADPHATKRTRFEYGADEIDISKYNDNY